MTTKEIKTRFRLAKKGLREAYSSFKIEKDPVKFGADIDQVGLGLIKLKKDILEAREEGGELNEEVIEESTSNDIPF